jgi:hypothetical protein
MVLLLKIAVAQMHRLVNVVSYLLEKNATNLKVHPKTFHQQAFIDYEKLHYALQKPANATTRTDCESSSQLKPTKQQQGIQQYATASKVKGSAAEVAKHNGLLVNTFIGTGLSTRLMDHPDFRALFSEYELPGAYCLSIFCNQITVSIYHITTN